jgi:hypothetical protein
VEPEYLAQTAETSGGDERQVWIRFRADEARSRGITFFRAAYDDKQNLLLLEGWKERPEDQGEPRWQMTSDVKDGH